MKFIKSTGIYLLGNVLSKAASFLLLPLYTNYLSPNDYGVYDLSIAYNSFLISILFLDIWDGTMRFMFDYKDYDKNKPITIGFIMFMISSILYGVVLLILGHFLGLKYLELLFLVGITSNFQQVVGYIARGLGKNYAFVLYGLVGSVTTLVTNIVLLTVFNFDYRALYISTIVGMALNILGLSYSIDLKSRISKVFFSSALFREMVRYSLPLCVNSAAWWFLTGFNRVIISERLSAADNGMYAVATKFSSMLMLVTTGFQMAWQEFSYSLIEISDEEKDTLYSRAINEYSKFLYLGLMAILPVIKIIFPYFIGNEYSSAISLVPIVLYATFFSSIAAFLASIINVLKKNQFIFFSTLSSAIVNVVVLLALLDIIGIQAATISLCCGYFVNFIIRTRLVKKFVGLRINYLQFTVFTLLFFLVVYVYICGSIQLNLLMFIGVMVLFFVSYRRQITGMINSSIKK